MVSSDVLRRVQSMNVGSYRSPHFAPKYQTPLSLGGMTLGQLTKYGRVAGAFGVSAGVFLVFFMGEVPRVRNDILRQFPFLNEYYDRRLDPEDNPF